MVHINKRDLASLAPSLPVFVLVRCLPLSSPQSGVRSAARDGVLQLADPDEGEDGNESSIPLSQILDSVSDNSPLWVDLSAPGGPPELSPVDELVVLDDRIELWAEMV